MRQSSEENMECNWKIVNTWIIQKQSEEGKFWNNQLKGWVTLQKPFLTDPTPISFFTDEEKETFPLPMGGVWILFGRRIYDTSEEHKH